MRKLICLALGHRLRVVQSFGPVMRRVKCVRCGGDWGMHDDVHVTIDWDPDLEQLYRDAGAKILEPKWEDEPAPPTTAELICAFRWPMVLVLAASAIVAHLLEAAGFGPTAQFFASFAIGAGSARLVIRREYERRRRTLLA